ncbi:sporulation-control protein [Aneurinibacillus soli]|uniref:Sporulation-control protein spo0M n=1 Tax=Aneurinibacillus soli TaxID=1500254 RepID=A0A0U4WE65_9BACL|nr:sporulation protein [Aneurinibacillus soli]PYE62504.1 sporulation-control protein [Aneurinibacillus soli]BAU27067.1 Sporulation-control protein spo0M [Aneurinibacillus soli]
MFKKFMAKIGIGSAKVNLVLHKDGCEMGQTVTGDLMIEGGSVEQKINRLDVDFMLSIRTKQKEYVHRIATIPMSGAFVIGASERKVLPFSFALSPDLLVSAPSVAYYFTTHLDIAGGVDSGDRDYLHVLMPHYLANTVEALRLLGLMEKPNSRKFDGYTQQFEFAPTTMWRGQIEEVEFVAAMEPDGIRLLLEVDLYSFGRETELRRDVYIPAETADHVQELAEHLRGMIDGMIENPQMYMHVRDYFGRGHHHDYQSYGANRYGGFAGALGGLAVGMLGGMILSEIMGDFMEDALGEIGDIGQEIESAAEDFGGDLFDGGFDFGDDE